MYKRLKSLNLSNVDMKGMMVRLRVVLGVEKGVCLPSSFWVVCR